MSDRSWPFREALFTDQYELTMAQAYRAEGLDRHAVFELYFRTLPAERNHVVAAGLEDVLQWLEEFRFTDDDLAYLRDEGTLSDEFVDSLSELRFTGDVHAVPEGTPVFANEPLVQVVAPIAEAQLVETLVLNQVHFQSVAAAKAARVVSAARGRTVVDFGSRRAHGTDAALKVARVTWLVGGAGSSNVLAGRRYGLPVFGTMAHSYVQAHDDEDAAFRAFAAEFPETTLLVDTYDTLAGVRKVVQMAEELGDRFRIRAVRLDSGNLAELAKQTRTIFDEAGLNELKIFASSSLDEYAIAELLDAGAPIDGFGVGTKLAVADGATDLDMAYKLVEYDGRPRTKLSTSKELYPGRKQVFRSFENGVMTGDVIGRHDEELPGEPLLVPVTRNGRRLDAGRTPLAEAREYAVERLRALPESLRALQAADPPYPVRISDALQQDLDRLRRELRRETEA